MNNLIKKSVNISTLVENGGKCSACTQNYDMGSEGHHRDVYDGMGSEGWYATGSEVRYAQGQGYATGSEGHYGIRSMGGMWLEGQYGTGAEGHHRYTQKLQAPVGKRLPPAASHPCILQKRRGKEDNNACQATPHEHNLRRSPKTSLFAQKSMKNTENTYS